MQEGRKILKKVIEEQVNSNMFYKSKLLFIMIVSLLLACVSTTALAKQPKAKFYDFSEQLIDGEIKKPTTLYTDARKQVNLKGYFD